MVHSDLVSTVRDGTSLIGSNTRCDITFSEAPSSLGGIMDSKLSSRSAPDRRRQLQSGIPAAGNMLLANGEEDTIALFIITLAEGDATKCTLDKV